MGGTANPVFTVEDEKPQFEIADEQAAPGVSEQQRLGKQTPPGIAPMKAQTETEFEKQNRVTPENREAGEFLLGAASGASGLPETMHPVADFGTQLGQKPSAMDVAGESILGPAYGLGKSVLGIGKDILSPTGRTEDPEDARLRRLHGMGQAIGTAAPLALGDVAEKADIPQKAANVRDTLGLNLRNERGTLRPGVATVGRVGGTLLGGGIGAATGIPGAAEAGGIAGALGGRGLMDTIVPRRPFDVPVKNEMGAPMPLAEDFYEARAKDLQTRGREQSVLDRAAAKHRTTPFGNLSEVPYGEVLKVPEPNENLPPVNPKYMASVPRAELLGMAENRTPGAAAQLGELGNRPLFLPEPGYPAPRSVTNLSETVEGNPTPFGGGITQELKPQVHTLSEKAETLSAPRKSLGAEWEAGERSHEIERNKSILRDPRATEEDKRIAQQRLNEVQDVFGEGNR